MSLKPIPRLSGVNVKNQPKRFCAIPGCGREQRNGGRFCHQCATLYHRMKNRTKHWANVNDEDLIAEVSRKRKEELKKFRVWKEEYRKEEA